MVGPRVLYSERHASDVWIQDDDSAPGEESFEWRQKERMKTTCGILCLCLNIGTDPPDVVKTSPCARMECWVNPQVRPAPRRLMYQSM